MTDPQKIQRPVRPVTARFSIQCPHCDGTAKIRTSQQVTRLVRNLHAQCQDVECGHTFGVQLQVTHTISPSARPRDGVDLRIAPPRAANQNTQPPANDDCAAAEPRAQAP